MNTVVAVHKIEPGGIEVSVREFPADVIIKDTMPAGGGVRLCRVDGGPGYVSREHWGCALRAGSIVEWIDYPGDADGVAEGLQWVVAIVAAIYGYYGPLISVIATNVIQIAAGQGSAAQVQSDKDASSTYSTTISGNQARLYNVIPKICGRHQTFPPFAGTPYNEYDDNNEQYIYAVLTLGIGNHTIERTLIDDTDINQFQDVLTCTYLPPGTLPTIARANVITSPEVAGQDLLPSLRVGGYSACGPKQVAEAVGIDIMMPRGGGIQDASSGDLSGLEVSWRVDVCALNEFGVRISPYVTLATETRTVADREPQRWTYTYELDPPIRPMIRIQRLSGKSSNNLHLNDLVWAGMRAYLEGAAPLNPDAAHFEVIMRSSKQLSGTSQNRISVIANALVRQVMPDGTFGAEIASRNPADWFADLATSTTWGEGLDVSEVDMATIATLRQTWEDRQDRFDYVFDTSLDAENAYQVIAGAGRARSFRRGGVRTLARDQLVTLPRTAFTTRNCEPGSMVFMEEFPQLDMPDGVIIEYWDKSAWNYGLPIECPCPGVTSMVNPVRMRKVGITGRIHATREGIYEAAKIAYRRQSVQATTEMQGTLPAFLTAVRWQSELTRWKSGDVVEWDAGTRTMRLTEPPTFGMFPPSIVLIDDQGFPSEPIAVIPGATPYEVVLETDPTFTPSTDSGFRERTKYMLGVMADDELLVKMSAIGDGGQKDGAQLFDISAFVDDARIHTADNHLLPAPGEIQDPIDPTVDIPDDGSDEIIILTNHALVGWGVSTIMASRFRLQSNGEAHGFYDGDGSGAFIGNFPNEWLYSQPNSTDITGRFEVRATLMSGSLDTGDVDVWQNLSVTREWTSYDARFLVEIRDVATETVQDSAIIYLNAYLITT